MKKSELRALLSVGETLQVEFKESYDIKRIVDAVVCLANGEGGRILIGVTDAGQIVGVRPRHGAVADPTRIEAHIVSRTEPSVATSAEIVTLDEAEVLIINGPKRVLVPNMEEVTLDGAEVLIINVPRSDLVVSTTSGKYLRRTIGVKGDPQCLPMRPHEIMSRSESVSEQDFSKAVLADLTLDDLSGVELARFREHALTVGERELAGLSDADLFRALNLATVSNELTIGALLMFGTERAICRWLPNYEMAFHELERLEVIASSGDPMPLLRAMAELTDRISARNSEEDVEVGNIRVALPRFSPEAIRELVANALVHRDYRAIGTTLVQVEADALTISNPGGLPAGVTTKNLLSVPPRPRNPALADVFKRAGVVERTGRGINRAYAAQLSLGRPAPDYSRSLLDSVTTRLKAGPADKELAAFFAQARQEGQEFSLEDLLVLHEIRSELRITTARAAKLFQVGHDEARLALNQLVERGYVEARGENKGRSYHLAASLYKRLGKPAVYERVRGFQPIQQEQMVITFVKGHGAITRREAAELCKIDARAAGRLLHRLRDEGHLVLVGMRRTARYVLPEDESPS